LKQHYDIEEDCNGNRYLSITLDWDYKKCKVHLSMLGYVDRALACFGQKVPAQTQNQPHRHTITTYSAMVQYAKESDTLRLLLKEEKKYIQQVIGTFLYQGCTVDSTMLTALSSIASAEAEPTKETMANVKKFLDYTATHQYTVLTYHTSDMILLIHSNVSFLS
jgi:hypothetical protein